MGALKHLIKILCVHTLEEGVGVLPRFTLARVLSFAPSASNKIISSAAQGCLVSPCVLRRPQKNGHSFVAYLYVGVVCFTEHPDDGWELGTIPGLIHCGCS